MKSDVAKITHTAKQKHTPPPLFLISLPLISGPDGDLEN